MKARRALHRTEVCFFVPNIVLHELGLDFELTFVDRASKKTSTGDDYRSIHPPGLARHDV